MNILVRNLSREVTEKELWQLFLPFGKIKSISLVLDEATGKSKGFGFVDMPDYAEAKAAIKALNGMVIRGEKIRVKTTKQPDKTRPKHFETSGKKSVGKGRRSSTRGPSGKKVQ